MLYDFEIKDVEKLIDISNKNGYKLDFVGAFKLWQKFSEENYHAGWVSVDGFKEDFVLKVILKYNKLK